MKLEHVTGKLLLSMVLQLLVLTWQNFHNFVKKKFAASATVLDEPVGAAVMVQGNIVDQLQELLVGEHKIPKKYITIAEKKKRRRIRNHSLINLVLFIFVLIELL